MKKRSKRNFLLLEVLLALQLVAFGALYVIQNPLRYLREEIKTLQSMEYQHLADLTFSEIKEAFYLQQIPLNQIPKNKSNSCFVLWKEPLNSSCELLGKVYRYYRIYGKEKQGKDKNHYHLLTLQLFLSPIPLCAKELKKDSPFFTYKLFVQKK
jgi:hypothetical protein